jgi:putative membrane protein insertion efficiency factor
MIRRLLQIPIRFWHIRLAPALPALCRFHPSCAQYALDALDRHSLPRAAWLIVRRLARCNPLNAGGYDPVPGCEDCGGTHAAHPAARLAEREQPAVAGNVRVPKG